MKVYVEYAVIDNFVMDYMLLSLTVLGKSKESSIKKRVLSSLIGTVFAAYMPLADLSVVASVAFKILTAALMVYFVMEYKTFAEYGIRFVLFFTYTFVFGGVIYGISSVFGVKYDPFSNAFGGSIPLAVFLIIGAAVFFVCRKGYFYIFRRRAIFPFLRHCVLYYDGEKIECGGFIDSGNSIMFGDEFICVAGRGLAEKLRLCGITGDKNARTIPFKTASGYSEMKVFCFDKMIVINGDEENIIYKVKIGIPETPTDFGSDYSLILPTEYA